MALAVRMNPSLRSLEFQEMEAMLRSKIIGQDEPISRVVGVVQSYLAGLTPTGTPIANVLMTGSSGVGKTKLVSSLAECLFGTEKAFTKIACGEYQLSQDIAKIVGAPPGFTGHKDTSQLITQESLDRYQTAAYGFSLVLFDEIEKAHDSLYRLLLGILSEAELKTNLNTTVDFSRTIIFMTSNLGMNELKGMRTHSLGFSDETQAVTPDKAHAVVRRAVERHFAPEFIGRITHSINFNSLTPADARLIVSKELGNAKRRIFESLHPCKFSLAWSDAVVDAIVDQGFSPVYGARNLQQAIQEKILSPIAGLAASHQIRFGDTIRVEYDRGRAQMAFLNVSGDTVNNLSDMDWHRYNEQISREWSQGLV
jgi:ATP-dependent Clp protease ATP-binding subunit ClpA